MDKRMNITEAEWPIMRVLWENGSATAAEIVDSVMSERDIAMRTVKTLLRRLIAKKAVAYAIDPDDSRIYHYRAMVKKEEAIKTKNRNFLDSFYQNNLSELLGKFLGDADLTEEQITDLQKILDKKRSDTSASNLLGYGRFFIAESFRPAIHHTEPTYIYFARACAILCC